MDEGFDGEAISRADREFLASLDEHPLRRNPLYGTPCPPQPDFGPFDPKDKDQTAERLSSSRASSTGCWRTTRIVKAPS